MPAHSKPVLGGKTSDDDPTRPCATLIEYCYSVAIETRSYVRAGDRGVRGSQKSTASVKGKRGQGSPGRSRKVYPGKV